VLCQFSDERKPGGERRQTLADFIDIPGIYAAGRLDRDSEGLLLLTDDGRLQNRIASPDKKIPKTYLVQLEGVPSFAHIEKLKKGVRLNDGVAQAQDVRLLHGKPGWLWARAKPVHPRKGKRTSWLEIDLTEGRNRQVRRMTAAVGLPTLRLVRTAISQFRLDGLQPGEWKTLKAQEGSIRMRGYESTGRMIDGD
jgi:23S rRNA pseudouridine2457 synthase